MTLLWTVKVIGDIDKSTYQNATKRMKVLDDIEY